MNIHGCLGCRKASNDPEGPCIQKDDMGQLCKAFSDCNAVVFASPVYFQTISGMLKTAVDRLFAEYDFYGPEGVRRESVLLMTAGSKASPEAAADAAACHNNVTSHDSFVTKPQR